MIGSVLVLTISVIALNCEPKRLIPGGRFANMFATGDDYSAFTRTIRVPRLTVPEISAQEQLLRPERTVPLNPPTLKCGPKAFRSALSSDYIPDSIRSTVCAGNYGISRVRATGAGTSVTLGFFAVDPTGRWRLVATAPNDAEIEQVLPDGFPESLIARWAKR